MPFRRCFFVQRGRAFFILYKNFYIVFSGQRRIIKDPTENDIKE